VSYGNEVEKVVTRQGFYQKSAATTVKCFIIVPRRKWYENY